MDLTVNYSIATNDSEVACDSAIWNGNVYDTSGICRYLTNRTRLWSIVTMDLTIHNSIATNDSAVACDSAVWNGNIYDTINISRYLAWL